MSAAAHELLHPLLGARWSPVEFDGAAPVSTAEVDSLLEAARWAPSAGNSQPWAFLTVQRGEPDHFRLIRHLTRSSAAWAPSAAMLVANLRQVLVEDTDWEYSEFSSYDLGQAVAHMTIQAQALGLAVRQFRAFCRDGIAAEFAIPPHWEVTTMSAIGHIPLACEADAADPPNQSRPVRRRRSSVSIRGRDQTLPIHSEPDVRSSELGTT